MSITAWQLHDNLLLTSDQVYKQQGKGNLQVLVAPPAEHVGHVRKWVTDIAVTDIVQFGEPGTGNWEQIEDHQKDKLWISHGKPYTLGQDHDGQSYGGLGPVPAWLHVDEPEQPLEDAKATKIAALSAECATRITAGFESGALGATHHYPAKDTDQRNLASSVLASLIPELPSDWTTPFWCADAAGDWAMRPHTAAQIQQVGQDGKAAILALMTQNEALAQQVNAATVTATVEQITWPT